MSSLSDSLGALARGGGRLLRVPSAIVLGVAGLTILLLAVLVTVLVTQPGGPGPVGAVLLVVFVAALAVPVVTLAIRRQRWLAATAEVGTTHRVIPGSARADVPGATSGPVGMELLGPEELADRVEDQMRGRPGEDDVRAVFDAVTEAQVPGSTRGAGARLTRMLGVGRLSILGRAFGRVDQAQRALMTAAGGPVAAPYLKDDLRVTLAAALGTLVAIPLGGLAAIIIAIVLLAR